MKSMNQRTAFGLVALERSVLLATARFLEIAISVFCHTSSARVVAAFQFAFAFFAVRAAVLGIFSASYRFAFAIVAVHVVFTTSGINFTDIVVCFPALEAKVAVGFVALEVTCALIILAACLVLPTARGTGCSVAKRAGGADVLSATSGPKRSRAGSTGPTIILVAPEKDETVNIASRLDHVEDTNGLSSVDGHTREQSGAQQPSQWRGFP